MENQDLLDFKNTINPNMVLIRSKQIGEEKDTSVLFVDIANYTEFTEKTPGFEVAQIMNHYFKIAGNIIGDGGS